MTQKQAIGLVVGVLVLGAVFVSVYQQFTGTASRDAMSQKPAAKQEEQAAVPVSIDGISESIAGETAADLSALDAEESGELSDIQADSDSVNNLGTSYDENSL